MTFDIISKLAITALYPLVTSVVLYFFFKNRKENNYWLKQIIIGIIFGLLAVLGTEKGVVMNGASINARDAAPLCASLIFGAPAGIIAGVIGGVERYFAVYWGAGTFTRLACAIATIESGLFGAVLKKHMFENKVPSFQYALAIGVVAEVNHMLMVFVTHLDDITNAFKVVKLCTIPMISVNAIAVMLAILTINIIDKDDNYDKKNEKPTISKQFLRASLAVFLVALVLANLLIVKMQTSKSETETKTVLETAINDVITSIEQASDKHLLEVTENIRQVLLLEESSYSNELLTDLAKQFNVYEISIISGSGYIEYSTNSDFIGFDMSSGEQAAEFLILNEGKDEYVQKYQAISYDDSIYCKYAGKSLVHGFVQVGYNAEQFQKDIESQVSIETENRHVGTNGGLLIIDSDNMVVSDLEGKRNEKSKFTSLDEKEIKTVIKETIDGVDYYYMFSETEGYTIISYIPCEEADFSKELALYMDLFTELIMFAALFVLTYFMIKGRVVDNIQKVNVSLEKIADGNLDEVLNIRDTVEFDLLSSDINTTVDSMKKLIAEANARIDSELQYAKEIQKEALPSIFPDSDNYDIYASMTPAKEVGGDFYDFYMLPDNHLAILIADVSGKGIPAALFMMKAKSIMKSYAEGGIAVADIFTNANFNLCEGNVVGMFVTCFMAVVDLKTGEVKFANAGHNPPLIRRKDGSYEYLKCNAGFILAGMEGIVYKEQKEHLNEGDEIYLYTDGVVEATNAHNELYGEERLKQALDLHKDDKSIDMCIAVKEDVDKFVGEAPQFDDLTMLSLKIKKYV